MLTKNYFNGSKKSLRYNAVFLFIIGLLLISPLFALLPKASTIINLLIIFFILLKQKNIREYKLILFVTILTLSTALIPALFHSDFQYLFLSYFFLSALFIVLQCEREDILQFVDIATNFIILLLLGSFIGFLYAFLGGSPIFTFSNPNGIPNEFFLTTMTNARWINIIRPSGIYDEPGAFSFFICSIALFRKLLNLKSNKTWLILFLGLITFSVAHILYLLFHVISEKKLLKISTSKFMIFSILLIIFFVISFTPVWDAFDMIFFSRFKNTGVGLFPGDNRSDMFFNTWNYIIDNPIVIYFGMPLNTDFVNIASEYGNIGANMLMNLLRWGIFSSWQFYAILLIFIKNSFKSRSHLVYIGFILMLSQREFIYVVSYSMMIIVAIRLLYFNTINEKKNNANFWYKTGGHKNGTLVSYS
jgi:hypothetical protein